MRVLLWILLGISLLGVAAAGGLYLHTERYFQSPGPLTQETSVHIEPGTGFKAIVMQLSETGVIDQPYLFMGKLMLDGNQRHFKAGEYLFDAGISPHDVAEKLVDGDVVVYSVTIAEGLRSSEILDILNAEPALTGDLPNVVPDGTLLPETYHFVRGDSRMSVLTRMQQHMTRTLEELWEQRRDGLPLSTPDDAVILASIVEKETGQAEERPRVAAVFINRLVTGMKLQSDPTVIYGIIDQTGEPPKRLLIKHLKAPNPYNTYYIQGLPPGPIANPGRASLEAVLQAPVTDEFYFVADGTGGHRFAKTLREHNNNVRLWRKHQRSQ